LVKSLFYQVNARVRSNVPDHGRSAAINEIPAVARARPACQRRHRRSLTSANFSLPRPTSNPRPNVFDSSACSCATSSTTACPEGTPLLINAKATGAPSNSSWGAAERRATDPSSTSGQPVGVGHESTRSGALRANPWPGSSRHHSAIPAACRLVAGGRQRHVARKASRDTSQLGRASASARASGPTRFQRTFGARCETAAMTPELDRAVMISTRSRRWRRCAGSPRRGSDLRRHVAHPAPASVSPPSWCDARDERAGTLGARADLGAHDLRVRPRRHPQPRLSEALARTRPRTRRDQGP
jgi:hypothetical protein